MSGEQIPDTSGLFYEKVICRKNPFSDKIMPPFRTNEVHVRDGAKGR